MYCGPAGYSSVLGAGRPLYLVRLSVCLLFVVHPPRHPRIGGRGGIPSTMAKSTKAPGPPIPPRRKSLSWDDSSQGPLAFPRSHHLIVTTAKGVFTWSSHGVKEIFRSGSEGIVAAKKASNGSGLLAVADSQVVVLHDVNKGMQRSYRLKGSDVRAPCFQCAINGF